MDATGSSSNGSPALNAWKEQMKTGGNLLLHAMMGFNRTVQNTDPELLANEDFSLSEEYNDLVSIHTNYKDLRKRKIKSIRVTKPSNERYEDMLRECGFDPDIPVNLDGFNPKRRKTLLIEEETLRRLINIENIVKQPLQETEEGSKKLKKIINKSKADFISFSSVSSSNNPPKEFKLWGQPDFERFLKDKVIDIIENPGPYEKFGVKFPDPVLLYGPPGTGKTSGVRLLAEVAKLNVLEVDASSVGSSYIHETSVKIHKVFEEAKKAAPSIVIIDEIDTIMSEQHKTGRHTGEEVAALLKWISEASEHKILVVGMTNEPGSMSDAAMRSGRFTEHFEVKPLTTEEEIKDLLQYLFADIATASNFSLKPAIKHLMSKKDCTIADVHAFKKKVCCKAAQMREDEITQKCLVDVIKESSRARRS